MMRKQTLREANSTKGTRKVADPNGDPKTNLSQVHTLTECVLMKFYFCN